MRLLPALTALLFAVWLPLAALMVVLSPPATHLLAEQFVDTDNSELSHDYLVFIADETRAFALGDDSAELPLGTDQRREFPPDVIGHLLDVRAVFLTCIGIFVVISILVLVLILILAISRRLRRLSRPVALASVVPLAAAVLLAVLGALNFDVLFTLVHQVFFAQGSWLFAYDSLLICALPQPFWIGCAALWAIALALLSLLGIFASRLLRRL
jgi:integral membrane protein (TIGR01906 family)